MTKTQKAKKYRLGNEPGQIMPTNEVQDMNIKRAALNLGLWHQPVQVTRNNFIHKSLSDFALNFGIGCTHGCLFCYVPDTSTKKQGPTLKHPYGVQNPDAEWGKYAFLRPWDEDVFLKSLRQALMTPANKLSWDGHSAIMLCTTTDPYQTFHGHRLRRQLFFTISDN